MNIIQKIRQYIVSHKKRSILVLIILVVGVYYYKKTHTTTIPSYILASVEKGTIVSSVSGTGQISSSNEIALKPEVSGTLTQILVSAGSRVKKGQTIAYIDSVDARKNVRDAEISLRAAQLDLKKTETESNNTLSDQETVVVNAYNDYLNSKPEAITEDQSSSYKNLTISGNYTLGKEGVISLTTYPSSGGVSFKISGLATGAGMVNSSTPQPIGDTGLYILFPDNNPPLQDTWNITLPNPRASNYLANKNTYEAALKKLNDIKNEDGSNLINLESQKITVQERQNTLSDAQEILAKYRVSAPYDGVIGTVSLNTGNPVSPSTSIATILTQEQIAKITLNEVDVAKVQVGQKAMLTFDAIDELSIAGSVSEVDQIGTTSQGVVSYNVKITLSSSDERIKSGMSVSASVITNIKDGVLTVPSSAIKTSSGNSYVDIFIPALEASQETTGTPSSTPPTQTKVELGISDDINTEIISGLNEGDQIVTKTITSSSTTATTAPSIFSASGVKGASTGSSSRLGR